MKRSNSKRKHRVRNNTPPMRRGFNTSPMRRGFNTSPMRRGFNTSPMRRGFNTPPMRRGGFPMNNDAPTKRRFHMNNFNLLDSESSVIKKQANNIPPIVKEPEQWYCRECDGYHITDKNEGCPMIMNAYKKTPPITNEKLAEIFSNPVLKEPEYIAKNQEIEDLERKTKSLEQERNSIGSSTSSEWQRLDEEIFRLYDKKRELNAELREISNNFKKDGKRRRKKSRSSKRKKKSKRRKNIIS
jgi:hypothetical protein